MGEMVEEDALEGRERMRRCRTLAEGGNETGGVRVGGRLRGRAIEVCLKAQSVYFLTPVPLGSSLSPSPSSPSSPHFNNSGLFAPSEPRSLTRRRPGRVKDESSSETFGRSGTLITAQMSFIFLWKFTR